LNNSKSIQTKNILKICSVILVLILSKLINKSKCLEVGDFSAQILTRHLHIHQWGSCSPCAHTCLGQSSPHRQERKFPRTHICKVTFKHLPQAFRSHVQTIGQLYKIPPFAFRKSAGGKGGEG
jgi:hypothetical protein